MNILDEISNLPDGLEIAIKSEVLKNAIKDLEENNNNLLKINAELMRRLERYPINYSTLLCRVKTLDRENEALNNHIGLLQNRISELNKQLSKESRIKSKVVSILSIKKS
jgi:predicted nuclease with TOPRIM domain